MHSINLPPETSNFADIVGRGREVFPVTPCDGSASSGRRQHLLRRLARFRSSVSRDVSLSARLMLLVLTGVVPLLNFNLAMIDADFRDDRERAFHQAMVLSWAI